MRSNFSLPNLRINNISSFRSILFNYENKVSSRVRTHMFKTCTNHVAWLARNSQLKCQFKKQFLWLCYNSWCLHWFIEIKWNPYKAPVYYGDNVSFYFLAKFCTYNLVHLSRNMQNMNVAQTKCYLHHSHKKQIVWKHGPF